MTSFLVLFRHSKCPEGSRCAAIKIVTLQQHDNVLITYCVLQVTGKECTECNKALGRDLPVDPSLQMACDDNLLVFCSEINNRLHGWVLDGGGGVFGLERHRGQSLSKQQMVCWASLGVC